MTRGGRARWLGGRFVAAICILALGPTASRTEPLLKVDEPANAKAPVSSESDGGAAAPGSLDSLFDDDKETVKPEGSPFSGWHGFVQTELAHTYASPAHWSQFLTGANWPRKAA